MMQFLERLLAYISYHRKWFIIGGILFLIIMSVLVQLVQKSKRSEYVYQPYVMDDNFFSTTPRVKEDIVYYKVVDGLKKVSSGKEDEIIPFDGDIKRGNEILRTGEELQDGDILSERFEEEEGTGILYKILRIFKDGKIQEIRTPATEKDVMSASDAFEETGIADELRANDRILSQKSYIDANGHRIQETKVERNGKIQTIIKDLGKETPVPSLIDKKPSDLFGYEEAEKDELSNSDWKEIKRLRARRGNGKLVMIENGKEHDYSNYNFDKDYSAQGEEKIMASYPVRLERTLVEGTLIQITLRDMIKAEIASETVMAQVNQDVIATHGRKILIPRGSKVMGKYKPLSEVGARRLAIDWYRIMTPEGINIRFEGASSDAEGAEGTTGEIDRRLGDKYIGALASSLVSALTQIAVPVGDEKAKAVADAFTGELGALSVEELRKYIGLLPLIRIPQGTLMQIKLGHDIWFKPSRNGKSETMIIRNNN